MTILHVAVAGGWPRVAKMVIATAWAPRSRWNDLTAFAERSVPRAASMLVPAGTDAPSAAAPHLARQCLRAASSRAHMRSRRALADRDEER